LKISTTLEGWTVSISKPPANKARLETEVATTLNRATLREAVVHNPEVTLKISTTLEGRAPTLPPPNRARLKTEVAANWSRAALREAVVHKPETTLKISTTLEAFVFDQGSGSGSFDDISPPPNRARFDTEVAAKDRRAALREAVVHIPEVTLKISTALEGRPQPTEESAPPPNRARSETDVAAKYPRATLREAVVHNPEVTLKTSTTFWGAP
jgi:hypothetical protein